MSRKDYEQFAAALRDIRYRHSEWPETALALDELEDQLISIFKRDNSNFQPDKFRKAANP